MDRLLVSRTGDPQLDGAEDYCGRDSLNVKSVYQQLTIGGQETGVNEFPMMAGVVYLGQNTIKSGAVIISKRHVMSAAHCVAKKSASELAVVVGEHDITAGDSPGTEAFRVTSLTSHSLYNQSNYDYDVFALTLHEDIAFSDRVGPVCLPFKFANSDFAGTKVTVLGWGTEVPGGSVSPVLHKKDVDVISQPECRSSVASVTPRQLCTFTPGKDACQDDNDGPLIFNEPSNGLLYFVGLVSNGSFCAFTDVNTRVNTVLDWIVAVTQEDFCRL